MTYNVTYDLYEINISNHKIWNIMLLCYCKMYKEYLFDTFSILATVTHHFPVDTNVPLSVSFSKKQKWNQKNIHWACICSNCIFLCEYLTFLVPGVF